MLENPHKSLVLTDLYLEEQGWVTNCRRAFPVSDTIKKDFCSNFLTAYSSLK